MENTNIYNDYLYFEQIYIKAYGKYYERYPNAMFLFNPILRHITNSGGINLYSKILINELKYKFLVLKNKKLRAKQMLTFLIKNLNNHSNCISELMILSDIERYDYLAKRILVNYSVCMPVFVYNILTSIRFKNADRYYVQDILFPEELKGEIAKLDVSKVDLLLKDVSFMKKLDHKINEIKLFFANFLYKNNIKYIFSAGDSGYEDRIICEAAKLVNIPFYVFLHGYPQGSPYIGILPIYADKLFVWNKDIKETLLKIVGEEKKIEIFGYPKYDVIGLEKIKNKIKSSTHKIITFVSQPYEENGIRLNREYIYRELKKLENLGYKIAIRLHPVERKNETKVRQVKKYNFIFSKLDLVEEILRSEYIVGYLSSVLYEADIIKGNAIQLIDKNVKFQYPSIESIQIEELYDYLLKKKEISNFYSKNNDLVYDFEEKLKEIIGY
jgi:hypothetical protein